MARILINDLMDSIARQSLESAGHQVDEQKRTLEELSNGALAEYDAVLIRDRDYGSRHREWFARELEDHRPSRRGGRQH